MPPPPSSVSRPLSPHLQVYRPQLTSVLSILHRIAGVVLAVGAFGLAGWFVAVAGGEGGYRLAYGVLNSVAGRVLLAAWTLCTFYHLCNGVRHLLWDAGFGFTLPAAYLSGKIMVAAALVLSGVAWLL